MHYFIDGYNLLFRSIKAGSEDLQLQRQAIIDDLSKKLNVLNIDATIVFDSYYQKGLREKNHKQNFEILFTDEGETADECILDELRIRPNPRIETVVTSDKDLAWKARLKGAHTLTIDEFLRFLNQKWRKKMNPISKKEKEPEPIPPPIEKKETTEEFYLRTFEEALADDPFFKRVKERKEKRKSDYERWLDAFEEQS